MANTSYEQLQALLVRQPDLAKRLEGASDVAEAAARLVAIGAEHGITLDAAQVTSALQQTLRSALQARSTGALSDDQLDAIAGGVSPETTEASMMALGTSNTMVSFMAMWSNKDCSQSLVDDLPRQFNVANACS